MDNKNNYTRNWLVKISRNKDKVEVQSKDRFVQRIVAVGRLHSRPLSPRSFCPVSEYAQSIHFVFSTNQARALDPCPRPEGSWALRTRMDKDRDRDTFAHVLCTVLWACERSVRAANLLTRVWWVADR